jgi:hypothetical protein
MENTTLTVEWFWYRWSGSNYELQLSGNKTGLQNGLNQLITTLGNGNTTAGETWNCSVRAFDGYNYSIYNSSFVTIQNTAPNITVPVIMPALPNRSSTLLCNATAGDLDNATLTVDWQHYQSQYRYNPSDHIYRSGQSVCWR